MKIELHIFEFYATKLFTTPENKRNIVNATRTYKQTIHIQYVGTRIEVNRFFNLFKYKKAWNTWYWNVHSSFTLNFSAKIYFTQKTRDFFFYNGIKNHVCELARAFFYLSNKKIWINLTKEKQCFFFHLLVGWFVGIKSLLNKKIAFFVTLLRIIFL